jgi:hypothetical protein
MRRISTLSTIQVRVMPTLDRFLGALPTLPKKRRWRP